MTTTNPTQTLRNAIDYLNRYGWIQHTAYEWIDRTADRPAACVAGAIDMVSGNADLAAYAVACAAVQALATSLARHHHLADDEPTGHRWCWDLVCEWNDQAGRTQANVLSAMEQAADEYEHIHGRVSV